MAVENQDFNRLNRIWSNPDVTKTRPWRGCGFVTIIDDRVQERPESFIVLGELGKFGFTYQRTVQLYDNDG